MSHADNPRYVEAIRLITEGLIDAMPKGGDANVIVNGLLNAATQVTRLCIDDPNLRADMLARSIAFLIGEAAGMGVPLDGLRRHCQHLATDRESEFYA